MLNEQQFEELMKLLGMTQDQEIDCDDCLMKVSEFAEIQLSGKPVPEALQVVESHLQVCLDCREEYETLLSILKEMAI